MYIPHFIISDYDGGDCLTISSIRTDCLPFCLFIFLLPSMDGVSYLRRERRVGPSLRAWAEHILIVRVARAHGNDAACHAPNIHTGHSSSFQAISQNIHSYRELITNASSIRFFSADPAFFAHASTFARIHRCTSANSGEAYSMSQSR
jgi:hypothetical protein